MKTTTHQFLALTLICLLPSLSLAMGQKLPDAVKDESLSDAKVLSSFQLRAQDGSLIQISSDDARKAVSLNVLPAAKGANQSLCNRLDVNLLGQLVDASMRTMTSHSLSAADRALVQKTPRCAPYLDMLSAIAISLGGNSTATGGDTLSSLSIVVASDKNPYVSIKTSSGKIAMFKITSSISGLHSMEDLNRVVVSAATSGQNMNMQFQLVDSQDSTPSTSNQVVSCEVQDTVRRCEHDNQGREAKCETIYVSHPGHKQVDTTSSTTHYTLSVVISDAQNRAVFQGNLEDFKFNNSSQDGICYRD